MPTYEYAHVPTPEFSSLLDRLNDLGREGWQVVDHDWGQLILAREIPSEGATTGFYRCTDKGYEREEAVLTVPKGYRLPLAITIPLDGSNGSGDAVFRLDRSI